MPLAKINSQASIDQNIRVHDTVASIYDSKHVEIYNITEQNRIKSILSEAISLCKTEADRPKILDFGSGTGNLTKHLLDLQSHVIAGDVSQKSLDYLIKKTNGHKHLTTTILNGKDLIEFSDNSFDMIATYSVLHHVPNYLGIIDEFVRVTKPGGVIFIDHEVCPSYWERKDAYIDYLNELGDDFLETYQLETGTPVHKYKDYKNRFIDGIRFKRTKRIEWIHNLLKMIMITKTGCKDEGDLHTSKNDHIEWHEIINILSPFCQIIKQQKYLVCREIDYNPMVWKKWKGRCRDMKLILARKKFKSGQ